MTQITNTPAAPQYAANTPVSRAAVDAALRDVAFALRLTARVREAMKAEAATRRDGGRCHGVSVSAGAA